MRPETLSLLIFPWSSTRTFQVIYLTSDLRFIAGRNGGNCDEWSLWTGRT